MILNTLASAIASSKAAVPAEFAWSYSSGFATDSSTKDLAAQWITISTPFNASTIADLLWILAWIKVALVSIASECPVDRSSTTTTSHLLSIRYAVMAEPIKPAPPVISTLCFI